MTVDCQWIEKNLEALFCDGLNEDEKRLARAHIEICPACGREVQALHAIDPLVKTHFRRELAIARRPRVANTARIFGLSGAAVTVIAILLFVVFRAPQTNPSFTPAPAPPQTASAPATEAPPTAKENPDAEAERAKPVVGGDRVEGAKPVVSPPVPPDAPEFMVTDPAGYSHTADEYRGRVVVVGVWSPDQTEAVANLERLYKAYATNPGFRFLGVAKDRVTKPVNATFPVVYNQGSKLFGAQPGNFVLLNENGSVELRGSLVADFDALRSALQAK